MLAANRGDGPWSYTVEPGGQLADDWTTTDSEGVYDLAIHGPNGFLRVFQGSQPSAQQEQAWPEAAVAMHGGAHQLGITLSNRGRRACTFTVSAND